MQWAAIDPGSSGTGIAIFNGRRLVYWDNAIPPSRIKVWEERTQWISNYILDLKLIFPVEKTFIEWPTGMFSGRGVGAKNTDSILKLAFVIGRIVEVLSGEVVLLPVQKWRGSIPKQIVWKRAEKFFKVKGLNNHCGDAAGIGRWLIKNDLWR